jgi:hypothetical protein
MSAEQAQRLYPLKYQDGFLDEYWSAWERRVQTPGAAARAASR